MTAPGFQSLTRDEGLVILSEVEESRIGWFCRGRARLSNQNCSQVLNRNGAQVSNRNDDEPESSGRFLSAISVGILRR